MLSLTVYDQGLDPAFQHAEFLNARLRPYSSEELLAYPVSMLVNNRDTPASLWRGV